MSLTRRRFLLQGSWGIAASVLPFSWSDNATAVEPMTIISTASTSLSLIRAFSKPGNGLEAMLSANSQKLDLVIDQLQGISGQLANLSVSIDSLDDKFGIFLKQQYRDELIGDISGSSIRYATIMDSILLDPSVTKNDAIQRNFENISQVTEAKRAALSASAEHLSPEVAMILPLCLALEIGCQGYRSMPISFMLSTLNRYEDWVRKINGTNGIQKQLIRLTKEHDEAIKEAARTDIGRKLKISQALAGPKGSPGKYGFAPCSFLCEIPIVEKKKAINRWEIDDKNSWGAPHFCPVAYGKNYILEERIDRSLGVKLLKFEDGVNTRTRPMSGMACEVIVVRGGRDAIAALSDAKVKEYAEPRFTRFNGDITTFKKSIAQVNYLRSRIGFAIKAQNVLATVEQQIISNRSILGGI